MPSRRRSRSNAVAKLSGSSARMTPRLPDSTVGLTTTGNDRRSSRDIASTETGTVMNDGVGRPALFSFSRDQALVARRGRGIRRMAGQPQQARQIRRHHGRPIADGQDRIHRTHPRRPSAGCRPSAILHGIARQSRRRSTDRRAGRSDRSRRSSSTPSLRRGFSKHARLIAGRGRQQEDALLPRARRHERLPSMMSSRRVIAEPPALRWAQLNSTKARSYTESTLAKAGPDQLAARLRHAACRRSQARTAANASSRASRV